MRSVPGAGQEAYYLCCSKFVLTLSAVGRFCYVACIIINMKHKNPNIVAQLSLYMFLPLSASSIATTVNFHDNF